MPITRRVCAAALLVLAAASLCAQDLQVPVINRRITDLAGMLSAGEVEALETKLAEFEQATSNQIAVLTVPSLEGESLEDFSLRVAEKNQFGKKGRDNGVLLIIARDDHKLRIEVGRGLEGALTDALSGQIIRRVITPAFRRNEFDNGISAGLDSIMAATRGEYTGDGDGNGGGTGMPPVLWLILIFLFFGINGLIARSRRYTIGRGRTMRYPWWWGGGGGFGGGGFGGGGGGGWSGGGGGFGGGGASGSW